jgi:hypothetical protein
MRWLVRVAPIVVALVGTGCTNETKISEIEPNHGTFSGEEEIHIKGQGFPRSGVTVRFGTREAKGVIVESDHTIKAYSPAGDKNTAVDVSLVFDDGRAFVLKNGFRYVDSTQGNVTRDKFFIKASKEEKK